MGYVSIPTDLTGYSKSNSGTYTGNATLHRAIPHGLGTAPKAVFLHRGDAAGYLHSIIRSGIIMHLSSGASGYRTVAAVDNTNFYVGDNADHDFSGNANNIVYSWVAIA